MKISVIVTTYNRFNLLQETINSILNQTYKNFELIIIDNYSIDNTEKIVKTYIKKDKRIKYYKNKNNGIVAINRNFGINKSQGRFIAFCDDDDVWINNKLEKQILEFKKDKKIGLICTNHIDIKENIELYNNKNLNDNDFTFCSLLKKNSVVNSSVVVKKSVINDVGMIDDDHEIIGMEDYIFWLKISKKYKIKYINKHLVKYRHHSNVYRNNGLNILNKDRIIYKKLFNDGYIDINLFNKLDKRLNFRTIAIKISNDKTDLKSILKTKMLFYDKHKVIIAYILYHFKILNILKNNKNINWKINEN